MRVWEASGAALGALAGGSSPLAIALWQCPLMRCRVHWESQETAAEVVAQCQSGEPRGRVVKGVEEEWEGLVWRGEGMEGAGKEGWKGQGTRYTEEVKLEEVWVGREAVA